MTCNFYSVKEVRYIEKKKKETNYIKDSVLKLRKDKEHDSENASRLSQGYVGPCTETGLRSVEIIEILCFSVLLRFFRSVSSM